MQKLLNGWCARKTCNIATPGSITVDTGFNAGDQSISLAVGSSFVLREGDWFTLTGATTGIPRLHKALNVPIASAYDLNIWPGLRDDPDDETLTMTDEGKGIFRLASNDIRWSKGVNNLTSLSFDFVEALWLDLTQNSAMAISGCRDGFQG